MRLRSPGCVLAAALLASGAVLASPAEHWDEGVRHYAAERYREAQSAFERAVAENPGSAKATLWLGLAMGRRAEAMSGLRRLAAFSLARTVRRKFEEAVALDPANVPALTALQQFHLEAPGIVGGSKDEARALAERIESVDEAQGARAWARYYERIGDFGSAGEAHERARELDPEAIGHLVGHAGFLARRGMVAESDALFAEALERDSDSPAVLLGAAKAWIQAKRRERYPQAKRFLEEYLASDRRLPDSDPPSQVRKLLRQL